MSTITGFSGRLSGLLEVHDDLDARVHVERQVTLDRDDDGSWLCLLSGPDADDDHVVNILVLDQQVCEFFDLFAMVLADPDAHAGQDHRIERPAPAVPAA